MKEDESVRGVLDIFFQSGILILVIVIIIKRDRCAQLEEIS